jgi:hypothetical protein
MLIAIPPKYGVSKVIGLPLVGDKVRPPRSRHASTRALGIKSGGPLVKSGFCEREIIVAVRGEAGEIPATRVRPPNNDEGHTLTRSQRQRRHRPKETILVEGINRAHEPEDSTSRFGRCRSAQRAE